MIKSIIKKHINNLTINDINMFALNNGIKLKETESILIYDYIKKYWEELIFSDHTRILNEAKDKLEISTYNKIEELIIIYKNKFKNYL